MKGEREKREARTRRRRGLRASVAAMLHDAMQHTGSKRFTLPSRGTFGPSPNGDGR